MLSQWSLENGFVNSYYWIWRQSATVALCSKTETWPSFCCLSLYQDHYVLRREQFLNTTKIRESLQCQACFSKQSMRLCHSVWDCWGTVLFLSHRSFLLSAGRLVMEYGIEVMHINMQISLFCCRSCWLLGKNPLFLCCPSFAVKVLVAKPWADQGAIGICEVFISKPFQGLRVSAT